MSKMLKQFAVYKLLKGNSTETFSFWLQCVLMVLIQFTLHWISRISVVCNLYCQADTIITCHPPTENFLIRTLQLTYTHVWYIICIISSSYSFFYTENIGLIVRLIVSLLILISQSVKPSYSIKLSQSVKVKQSVSLSNFDSTWLWFQSVRKYLSLSSLFSVLRSDC